MKIEQSLSESLIEKNKETLSDMELLTLKRILDSALPIVLKGAKCNRRVDISRILSWFATQCSKISYYEGIHPDVSIITEEERDLLNEN